MSSNRVYFPSCALRYSKLRYITKQGPLLSSPCDSNNNMGTHSVTEYLHTCDEHALDGVGFLLVLQGLEHAGHHLAFQVAS